MKQLFLVVGLLAGAAPAARAQQAAPAPIGRHQLSVGAFGLAPNLGVQYHYRAGRFGTLGVEASSYFAVDCPGVQAGLVGRYYFLGQAPTGLYAQAKVGLALHRRPYYNMTGYGEYEEFSSVGAALGVGYQARLGPRWVAQAGAGFKAFPRATVYDAGPNGRWDEVGQPGSPLDAQLSVGYLL